MAQERWAAKQGEFGSALRASRHFLGPPQLKVHPCLADGGALRLTFPERLAFSGGGFAVTGELQTVDEVMRMPRRSWDTVYRLATCAGSGRGGRSD